PSTFNHGAGAENGSFSLTSPTGFRWSASATFGWLHTTSPGTGNGIGNHTVDVNADPSSRSGMLTIAGQTFTVTQVVDLPTVANSGPHRSVAAGTVVAF